MLRLRHSWRLAGDFYSYARLNRAWWVLLILPLIAVALLTVGTTHVVVPYTVYTLF